MLIFVLLWTLRLPNGKIQIIFFFWQWGYFWKSADDFIVRPMNLSSSSSRDGYKKKVVAKKPVTYRMNFTETNYLYAASVLKVTNTSGKKSTARGPSGGKIVCRGAHALQSVVRRKRSALILFSLTAMKSVTRDSISFLRTVAARVAAEARLITRY